VEIHSVIIRYRKNSSGNSFCYYQVSEEFQWKFILLISGIGGIPVEIYSAIIWYGGIPVEFHPKIYWFLNEKEMTRRKRF
jgi:hypothetical protein